MVSSRPGTTCFARCGFSSGSSLLLAIVLVAIQFIPYGRDHSNPRTVQEIKWNTPQTRALAQDACFACHSNLTEWPWYTSIAPDSWLTQHDVEDGRAKLNFSEWQRPQEADLEEVVEVLREKKMPPRAVPARPLGGAPERRSASSWSRASSRAGRRIRRASSRCAERVASATAAAPAPVRRAESRGRAVSRERAMRLGQREAAGEERAARDRGLAAELPDGDEVVDRGDATRRDHGEPGEQHLGEEIDVRAPRAIRRGPCSSRAVARRRPRRSRARASAAVVPELLVQPSTATSPSRTSIATTSCSPNRVARRRGTPGRGRQFRP